MFRQLSRGFTLIEVLVTLVILTFGLLGIAGLMAKGQRIAFEAYQRQQAVALASDMAERMRGNRLLASACPSIPPVPCTPYAAGAPITTPLGTGALYNDYLIGVVKDCTVLSCSIQDLALYDLSLWDGLLNGYSEQQTGSNRRIGGIVNALGCIQDISPATAHDTCTAVAPAIPTIVYTRTFRISVAWQGNDDTTVPAGSACGINQYGTETKRRIITYDLLLQQPCTP